MIVLSVEVGVRQLVVVRIVSKTLPTDPTGRLRVSNRPSTFVSHTCGCLTIGIGLGQPISKCDRKCIK